MKWFEVEKTILGYSFGGYVSFLKESKPSLKFDVRGVSRESILYIRFINPSPTLNMTFLVNGQEYEVEFISAETWSVVSIGVEFFEVKLIHLQFHSTI